MPTKVETKGDRLLVLLLTALLSTEGASAKEELRNKKSEVVRYEKLPNLGRQLVYKILNGYELPLDQQNRATCLVDDLKKAPNVYMGDSFLYEGEEELVSLIPFRKVDRSRLKVTNAGIETNAKFKNNIKVDFNVNGQFVYKFHLKENKKYLSCKKKKIFKDHTYCSEWERTKHKNKAYTFKVIGRIMEPSKEDLKTRLKNQLKIMVEINRSPNIIGVVYKDCIREK